ncbi:Bet v1-like protein [Dioscorea alata]|uniref:Bet v1-like protein n=1 Tax=Dioscorea alata TaxID=55571 RepID=A0ACB7VP42_DIOAL|nr:Bet v1-like protein [Dioscorea alata]
MQALAPVQFYQPLFAIHGSPRPFFFFSTSPVTTKLHLISPPPLLIPLRFSLSDSQDQVEQQQEEEEESVSSCEEDGVGFQIEIEKPGKKNRRRIKACVRVNADLETVWGVLTDYEGLADFISSLAVSQLVDKRDKFARLYQVGQQDLPFGLKFNAKGVLDCYEGDLETSSGRRRRDIQFNMVEGDFQTFQGTWSIEQMSNNDTEEDETSLAQREYKTTLSYIVELEPKLWLPVRLIEGMLSTEIKVNLLCIREEAERVQRA